MTRLSHNCSLDLRLLPKELVANELFFLADGGSEVVLGSTVPGSKTLLMLSSHHTNGPMGQLYMWVYSWAVSTPGLHSLYSRDGGMCEYTTR